MKLQTVQWYEGFARRDQTQRNVSSVCSFQIDCSKLPSYFGLMYTCKHCGIDMTWARCSWRHYGSFKTFLRSKYKIIRIYSQLLTQIWSKWVYSSFLQIFIIIEYIEDLVLAVVLQVYSINPICRFLNPICRFLNMHWDEYYEWKKEICPLWFLHCLLLSLLHLMKKASK